MTCTSEFDVALAYAEEDFMWEKKNPPEKRMVKCAAEHCQVVIFSKPGQFCSFCDLAIQAALDVEKMRT